MELAVQAALLETRASALRRESQQFSNSDSAESIIELECLTREREREMIHIIRIKYQLHTGEIRSGTICDALDYFTCLHLEINTYLPLFQRLSYQTQRSQTLLYS